METFLMMIYGRKNLALKSGHRSRRPKAENLRLWPNYKAYGHSLVCYNYGGDCCKFGVAVILLVFASICVVIAVFAKNKGKKFEIFF